MSRMKLLMGISCMMVLVLSIGFFIGFVSYVPIHRGRTKRQSDQRQRTEEAQLTEYIDKAAPVIVSETLDGEKWRLADQRGKIVLVFYWSVLCGHCIDVIPTMNSIYSKYGKREDFLLVGVHRFPDREIIACYCATLDILWPQLYEMGESGKTGFFEKMDIKRTPSICIIDREGTVRGIYTDVNEVEKEVRGLL